MADASAHDNAADPAARQPGAAPEQVADPVRETLVRLIAEHDKKGLAVSDATSFAGDLEWDSLTVMDFVAAVEDEFDIVITMNQQAEIETVGQLVAAVTAMTTAA